MIWIIKFSRCLQQYETKQHIVLCFPKIYIEHQTICKQTCLLTNDKYSQNSKLIVMVLPEKNK